MTNVAAGQCGKNKCCIHKRPKEASFLCSDCFCLIGKAHADEGNLSLDTVRLLYRVSKEDEASVQDEASIEEEASVKDEASVDELNHRPTWDCVCSKCLTHLVNIHRKSGHFSGVKLCTSDTEWNGTI